MSLGTSHRKAFRDIVRGYSAVEYLGRLVYIKHLTPHDQVELEDITAVYHNNAKERGLPTEQDMLELLEREGDWTKEDEIFLEKTKDYIENMTLAKKKIVIKSAQDHQQKLIDSETLKVEKKNKEKQDLIGNTCEKYAQQRTHDFYILRSFYSSPCLGTPLYSEDEYDELTQPQVAVLVNTYNDVFKSFGEEGIQYLILEEFYSPYLSFAEDSMQFYGKAFCELTYNQIRMIVYTRIFKNIFDNNTNIPDKIRKDPKALLDFGSISEEEKEKFRSKFDSGSGSTIVGAKEEDYEYLGISKPMVGKSLHEEAKKKGGSLSMQDMMKLSGV